LDMDRLSPDPGPDGRTLVAHDVGNTRPSAFQTAQQHSPPVDVSITRETHWPRAETSAPRPSPRALFASLCTFSGNALGYRIVSRVIDIVVASLVLIVVSPLLFVISVLIKLDSPGRVIFRHVRTGLNRRSGAIVPYQGRERRKKDLFGEQYVLYKFRTMLVDARTRFPDLYAYEYSTEELSNLPIKILVGYKAPVVNGMTSEPASQTNRDPRVTRVGRWLRKTSLDELPNLINVLKGDMRLVGPRPDIAENIRYYTESHREILRVRPGVTGLAQTRGRGMLSFIQTNEADLEYVRRRSLALDLRILTKTLGVTLKGDGAL
jgi:lipopolysaccharide/colanic/teichoic acid biosynthesis glycosyltransferase